LRSILHIQLRHSQIMARRALSLCFYTGMNSEHTASAAGFIMKGKVPLDLVPAVSDRNTRVDIPRIVEMSSPPDADLPQPLTPYPCNRELTVATILIGVYNPALGNQDHIHFDCDIIQRFKEPTNNCFDEETCQDHEIVCGCCCLLACSYICAEYIAKCFYLAS